eukprot:364472-Chlamydomonas_euryale.AAC.6
MQAACAAQQCRPHHKVYAPILPRCRLRLESQRAGLAELLALLGQPRQRRGRRHSSVLRATPRQTAPGARLGKPFEELEANLEPRRNRLSNCAARFCRYGPRLSLARTARRGGMTCAACCGTCPVGNAHTCSLTSPLRTELLFRRQGSRIGDTEIAHVK